MSSLIKHCLVFYLKVKKMHGFCSHKKSVRPVFGKESVFSHLVVKRIICVFKVSLEP